MIRITTRDGYSVATDTIDNVDLEEIMAGGSTLATRPRNMSAFPTNTPPAVRVQNASNGLYVTLRVSEIVRGEELRPEEKPA